MYDFRYGIMMIGFNCAPAYALTAAKNVISLLANEERRNFIEIEVVVHGANTSRIAFIGKGLMDNDFRDALLRVNGEILDSEKFYELTDGAYIELVNDVRAKNIDFIDELIAISPESGRIFYGPDSIEETRRIGDLREKYHPGVVSISLIDFLTRGVFCGIALGMDRDAVLQNLGVPDRWTVGESATRLESSECWGYECVSINFTDNVISEIWCSFFFFGKWPEFMLFSDFTINSDTDLSKLSKFLNDSHISYASGHIVEKDHALNEKKRRGNASKKNTSIVVNKHTSLEISFGQDGRFIGITDIVGRVVQVEP